MVFCAALDSKQDSAPVGDQTTVIAKEWNLSMSRKLSKSIFTSLALAGFTSCGPKAPAPGAMPPPPAVTVASPKRETVAEWEIFTGRTEAVESVEVRPRVSGHIQEVRFQSGQLVKKGDVLFVIDPRWHQAEFERREAEYQQATVRLENAEREAKRIEQLLANRSISIEESEGRTTRFQEAKAGVLAAKAARDSAQLDLEFTEVKAPIDGRVSRAWVTQGNYVAGLAGGATVLTTIVSVDPVYVLVDMDENSLAKFNGFLAAKSAEARTNIAVELQLAGDDGFPHRGRVESLDNRVDPGTGSILLRAVFENANGQIMPGLFARLRVPLSEERPALLIEERAIGTDQGQKFVLVLSPTNTVEYRKVVLGTLVNGRRVVQEGLTGSEQIVVNGLQRVRPGMPVTVEQPTASR